MVDILVSSNFFLNKSHTHTILKNNWATMKIFMLMLLKIILQTCLCKCSKNSHCITECINKRLILQLKCQ